MIIHPPHSGTPFEPGKGGGDPNFIKQHINELLSQAKGKAKDLLEGFAHSIKAKSPSDPNLVEDQQEEINQLFEEKVEGEDGIEAFLKTQIPENEIKPYLQQLREEWTQEFSLKNPSENATPKAPSPEDLFKSKGALTSNTPSTSTPIPGSPLSSGETSPANMDDFAKMWEELLEKLKEEAGNKQQPLPQQPPPQYPGLKEAIAEWHGTNSAERKLELYEQISFMISGGSSSDQTKNTDKPDTTKPSPFAILNESAVKPEKKPLRSSSESPLEGPQTNKASLQSTAVGVPSLDDAKKTVQKWIDGSGKTGVQNTIANKFLEKINALIAAKRPPEELSTWVKDTFLSSSKDIYMQFGFNQSGDVNDTRRWIAWTIGMPVDGSGTPSVKDFPMPTPMDAMYVSAQEIFKTFKSPSDTDKQIWNAMLTEMQNLGSSGNTSKVNEWATSYVLDLKSPFKFASDVVKSEFFHLTDVSPLQEAHQMILLWLDGSGKSGIQNKIATDFLAEINSLISSEGSKDQLAAWFRDKFFTSKSDIFMQYGFTSSKDVEDTRRWIAWTLGMETDDKGNPSTLEFPYPTALDNAFVAAQDFFKSLPNPSDADKALWNGMLTQIQNLGSRGNMSQLKEWAVSYILDPKSSFPSVSANVKAEFYQLTGVSLIEEAHRMALLWLAGSGQSGVQNKIATDFLAEINRLIASGGSIDQLKSWFQEKFISSKTDIYMQYGFTSAKDVFDTRRWIAWTIGMPTDKDGTPSDKDFPRPTALDNTYVTAQDFFKSLSNPSDADKALWNAMLAQMQNLGSQADLSKLKEWAVSYILDPKSSFPSVSANVKAELYQLTGASPMEEAHRMALLWLAGSGQSGVQNKIASDFLAEINSLIASGGSMDQLKAWFQEKFISSKSDIYMQYGFTSEKDVYDTRRWIAWTIGMPVDKAGTPSDKDFPPPTAVDKAYALANDYLSKIPSREPDKTIWASLLRAIQDLGSRGDLSKLKDWATNVVNNDQFNFSNATDATKDKFAEITGVSVIAPIDNNIAKYLASFEGLVALIQALASKGLLGRVPTDIALWTNAQWAELPRQLTLLRSDYEALWNKCAQSQNWAPLESRYGIVVKNQDDALRARDIFKNSLSLLQPDSKYRPGKSHDAFMSALNLFRAAQTELKALESRGGTLADLRAWAANIDLSRYPGLTPADIAEFNQQLKGS